MNKSTGICEMCGLQVAWRQKAHIVAEEGKGKDNVLMLCPSCHVMFDTHVKPKVFKALKNAGVKGIPSSWEKSIYQQAAEASLQTKKTKLK